MEPGHSAPGELLDLRLQLRIVQTQIIHRADSGNTVAFPAATAAVHQRAADGAEEVSHCVSGSDGLGRGPLGELVFAFEMLHCRVLDDEVAGEH